MVITINSSSNDGSDSRTETDDDLKIKSNYQSTLSTRHRRKIYAFASRRPHGCRNYYDNDIVNENRMIINNLKKLVTEGDKNKNIDSSNFICSHSNVHNLGSQIMRNDDAPMQIANDSQMDLEALPHHVYGSSSTIQRMDIERCSVPSGSVFIREPKYPFEENSLKRKEVVVCKDTATRRDKLKNVPKNGEGESSLPTPSKKKYKKRKELEGLGTININGEDINLKYLARFADRAFNASLNEMTDEMETEDELLKFLNDLTGRWRNKRKRSKYVKASMLLKALPEHWEVLISFRSRVDPPNLYCRKFVSPSRVKFRSCKDVALDLKSKYATDVINHPDKTTMMQVTQVPASSASAAKSDRVNLKERCTLCVNILSCHHFDAENSASASSNSVVCPNCREELNSRVKSAMALDNQHGNK